MSNTLQVSEIEAYALRAIGRAKQQEEPREKERRLHLVEGMAQMLECLNQDEAAKRVYGAIDAARMEVPHGPEHEQQPGAAELDHAKPALPLQ